MTNPQNDQVQLPDGTTSDIFKETTLGSAPFDKGLVATAIHLSSPAPQTVIADLKNVEGAAPKLAALLTLQKREAELKEELKDIESQKADFQSEIQDLLGGDESPVEDIRYNGKPIATWKITRQRRLNQKRLRATVGDDIFETLKDEIVFRSFKVLPISED